MKALGENANDQRSLSKLTQGRIQANANDAGVSVKKICLNYFLSHRSK